MLGAAARADVAAQGLYQLVRAACCAGCGRRNLDALGLVAALQELCESWEERSGVACVFHHDGWTQALPERINITVYRVAQEALTNVMRHARAQPACALMLARDAAGDVQPGDAGRRPRHGPGASATRGLGLLGAGERAAALGGELRVAERAGRGRAAAAAACRSPAAVATGVERARGGMIRVVLADDHPVVRSGYRRLLEQEPATSA